jgi:DNA primase
MRERELLEQIDVSDFLNELGIRNVQPESGGEVMYSCPFPGHSHLDSTPSASMSTVERAAPDGGTYPPTTFHCFGCEARGTAITFLSEYERISPILAKRFIRERFAGEVGTSIGNVRDSIERILSRSNNDVSDSEVRGNLPLKVLSEEEVEKRLVDWKDVDFVCKSGTDILIPQPFSYMLERGFEWWTLEQFQIGWDRLSDMITIPLRDENGGLLGFKGRAWQEGVKPRYKMLGGEGYGFETVSLSKMLFALHIAKEYEGMLPMIVREGELNAMKLHELGLTNSVGISGKHLSKFQVDMIKKYASCVIVYFDDFDDSKEAAKNFVYFMPTYIAWSEADPADDPDGALEAINNAESALLLSG